MIEEICEAVLRIEANDDALVADDVVADTVVVPTIEDAVHSRLPEGTPQEPLTSEIVTVVSRAEKRKAEEAENQVEVAAPVKEESRYSADARARFNMRASWLLPLLRRMGNRLLLARVFGYIYRGYQLLRCKILRIKILFVCWVRVGGLIILNGGWSPGSRVLTPRDSGEKFWYPAIAGKNLVSRDSGKKKRYPTLYMWERKLIPRLRGKIQGRCVRAPVPQAKKIGFQER